MFSIFSFVYIETIYLFFIVLKYKKFLNHLINLINASDSFRDIKINKIVNFLNVAQKALVEKSETSS